MLCIKHLFLKSKKIYIFVEYLKRLEVQHTPNSVRGLSFSKIFSNNIQEYHDQDLF